MIFLTGLVGRVAFLSDAVDEVVHDDDLENHLDQIQRLNDRVQEALLVVDQFLVEEADHRLHGRELVVIHILGLVDGCEQFNCLWLLVFLTHRGHEPVDLQRLDSDRLESIVDLFVFIILFIAKACTGNLEAFQPVSAEVGGVARRVLNHIFIVHVLLEALRTGAESRKADVE